MQRPGLALLALWLVGCPPDTSEKPGQDTDTDTDTDTDGDGDGYTVDEGDCDDADASVNPGAEDSIFRDQDCDGLFDDGLATAEYALVGEGSSDNAGNVVSSAGDVDGDGLSDLLVGAHHQDGDEYDAGKVYLVLGTSLGTDATLDLASSDRIFAGEAESDYLGYSSASAGDVDGDGLPDLVMGAPSNDDGGSMAGKAYLVLGGDLGAGTAVDLSAVGTGLVGEVSADNAGISVAGLGDVDGDGLSDLLVGAHHGGDEDEGRAYLLLSGTLGAASDLDLSDADYVFVGESEEDYAGYAVASPGDVDGDGLSDLLVGAYGNDQGGEEAGKAYLVWGGGLGADSSVDLADADHGFTGENEGDHAGVALSGAGDVDGDGLPDLLLGAPRNDEGGTRAGKAYLVLGASLGASSTLGLVDADIGLVGEAAGDSAGGAVGAAGDVDGDGLSDLLVGAGSSDEGGYDGGKAYLLLGAGLGVNPVLDLSSADHAFVGETAGDTAGSAVGSAGDVDGDGLSDLLLGAPENDDGGKFAGKAYLLISPY